MDRSDLSSIQTFRESFTLKLGVLFLIVLVVIAGIGGIIYVQTGATLEQNTRDEMEHSTVLQAETLGEWVNSSEDSARYLSSANAVQNGNEASIEEFLRTERAANSDTIAAIHYYNTVSGTIVSSSEGDVSQSAYDDVEWATEDQTFENDREVQTTYPYEDPTIDGPAVGFVSPVPGTSNRAIVVVTDLENQTNQLERPSGPSDEAFTHVVDDRGTVVMSHHTDDINTQNAGSDDEFGVESEAVNNSLDGETGYMEMPMEHEHQGQEQLMAMGYAPVPGANWSVMTHVPTDDAYALQGDVTQAVLALVAFSVIGLGAIGVVIGRGTTRSISRLASRARELEQGNLDVELETDRVDEIGQLYDALDNMRVALREQIQEIERSRQQAERARQKTERLNSHLERKADDYQSVMRECADGDLTRRLDPDSENEAMEEIGREFNEMVAEIETTAERLSRFATEVATSSEEVTASTEEVHAASEQVTESIQEISDGAERQNENLQTVNAEMEGLSTTTEQIAASSNQVSILAERTVETSQSGQVAAHDAIEGMSEIEAESEAAVDEIETLEAEMNQIDDLVEFISEVAEQTNMLALNANIEASRSADSSEGFSVVAGEVKDLAEETKTAAEDIEARIEAIKTQTGRTAEEVQRTSDRIANHRDAIEQTVDALDEIATYAEETSDGVQEISAATEQQAASTQEVVAMIDEVATISEETTAKAQTVAAAGEEQTTALTEVSRAIGALSDQASQLSAQLDEFETDAGIAFGRSSTPDEPESAATVADFGGDEAADWSGDRAEKTGDEVFSFDDEDDR